jgi:hypothetical protein
MTSPSEPSAGLAVGLRDYLLTCRELAALCSQNGWIDNGTLAVDVVEDHGREVVAAVTFEEVIMEGAGCIAGRVPCYGRVRAHLGSGGEVDAIDIL